MTQIDEETSRELRIPVLGMSCAGCASRLSRTLGEEEGVREASVNFASELASVSFAPPQTSSTQIVRAIEGAGFQVPTESLQLRIGGMTCAGCAKSVEKALSGIEGVQNAQVNAATGLAHVTGYRGLASPADLILAAEKAGYSATAVLGSREAREAEEKEEQRRQRLELVQLSLMALLAAPLVAPMIASPLGLHVEIPGVLQLALALPMQTFFGARFYVGSVRALRGGSANMDTLVSLGTTAAFLLSLWHLITGGGLYFESAAVIIALIRTGKWLEARAKRTTNEAIRSLMDLRPELARVERAGELVEVPAEAVVVGDVVLVRPGERLPVDGEILEGASELDESLLTGESLPCSRSIGDRVVGGAINGSGLLRIQCTHATADALLSRIVQWVQDAQGSRAKVQDLVDRISAVFVPSVLLIATATLAAWLLYGSSLDEAIVASVSVLVIACPCALGLATPAALSVGTGVAARLGILIQDAKALEDAEHLSHVVFDKTGTLTQGRPQVLEVQAEEEDDALRLAASVQRGSEHVLGKAILDAAAERNLSPSDCDEFVAIPGRGVSARVEGELIYVGSPGLLSEHGLDQGHYRKASERLENQGATVVWGFSETRILAAIGIGDEIREGATRAISRLHDRGLCPVLLTGDNHRAAKFVAQALGIETVLSEVLPDEKAEKLGELQKAGHRVAMVGDGINDAPALATADVSFAMGSGSDVAMQTASVTLMRSEPTLVVDAIEISRATTRKIHQNLFWAFGFNTIGIPLAALGHLTPMLAGGAMAFSSVAVLGNALLLRSWKPRP